MADPAAPKPYKGPESYQAADAALFYGRDAESDQLIARIVSNRFTLLHAQSGAGKTSLLNARVIPGLQSRSLLPVRVLPQNDPVESIRVTTLQSLFPPLTVERDAIQAARDALLQPGEEITIETLLARFDALAPRHPQRLSLIRRRPAETPVAGSVFPRSGEFDPVFARLLRGNIDASQLNDHLEAMRAPAAAPPITAATSVNELLARVAQLAAEVTYEDIVNQFYGPVPDLRAFFENIAQTYGRRYPRFRIVLVLDQFEELFTRFVDLGALEADLPVKPLDWRLRWELFDELKRLYATPPLPIHFVISMRDEYLAQIDPLRAFVPELDSSAFHLRLLSPESAREAIRRPAQQFGYDYSDECFSLIVSQLTKENRFIEPTHLQIVCEKLWVRRGQELAAASTATAAASKPAIEAADLAALNGAAGILRSFFRDFLDELRPDMRMEALEMLELLVTSAGSRNIVELHDLTHPEYRRATSREEILRRLEQRTIVRLESRLGGQFAEITHEFLIGPILQAVREELQTNPDYGRLRVAPRILAMFDGIDFRVPGARLLGEYEFRSLHQLRNDIRWEDWSVELMLRSAVVLAAGADEVRYWTRQYESWPVDIDAVLEDAERARRLLSRQQVQMLRAIGRPFSDSLALKILTSVLTFSLDDERDEIEVWTRRLLAQNGSS